MLYDHTFVEGDHIYRVEGEYTLATSDVIELNGLSDFGSVPSGNLAFAGHRGSAVHLAIPAFESEESVREAVALYEQLHQVKVWDEVEERMEGYQNFRKEHDVRLVGKPEKSRVYRHEGTEQLIGTTIDFTAYVDGVLTVVDTKTCHPQYGEKMKQLKLKWLLQVQSYVEALEADDDFWRALCLEPSTAAKAVLHLHPEAGKVRGKEPAGFKYYDFPEDAQYGWDSAIRMARMKLASGYKLSSKVPRTMELKTRAELAGEGAEF
jgi:hypothetical protein